MGFELIVRNGSDLTHCDKKPVLFCTFLDLYAILIVVFYIFLGIKEC